MNGSVMSFKISDDMRDKLKDLAAKRDVPVSQLIREAIKYYLVQEVE